MKLSISPKKGCATGEDVMLPSHCYDILVDGHKLPTGVKKIEIIMEAGKKPELIAHADLGQLSLEANALTKLISEEEAIK